MKSTRSSQIMCVAILVFTSIQNAAAAADPLYHNEGRSKNAHGQELVMVLQELHRGERTSLLSVKCNAAASTASVANPMFVMRGCYDMATARGATYFIILKESEKPDRETQYLIGFSSDQRVDPKKYFGLKEPLPKDEEHTFTAVKDFDIVFKAQR